MCTETRTAAALLLVLVLGSALPRIAHASNDTLTLVIDRSGSVHPEDLALAMASTRALVQDHPEGFTGIELLFFADSDMTPAVRAVWGPAPMRSPFDPGAIKLTIQERVYRVARERRMARERESWAAAQFSAQEEYERRVAAELERAFEAASGAASSASPCTFVADAAMLAARARGKVIVLTDGVPDCPEARVAPPPARPDTLLVLLRSRRDSLRQSRAQLYEHRERYVRRFFPSASVSGGWNASEVARFLSGADDEPVTAHDLTHEDVAPAFAEASAAQSPPAAAGRPRIVSPADKSAADLEIRIEGVGGTGRVVVVVHPLQTREFWCAGATTVLRDHTWIVDGVIIGRAGTIDKGRKFQVVAIAGAASCAVTGEVLGGWPEGVRSATIEVTRR